jgi:hypothetical protein
MITSSLGRKVMRVTRASAVSPSTSRHIGGGLVDEAPDLSRVLSAASANSRT